MQTNDDTTLELVELGSVTADTAGADGLVPEGFETMRKIGISAE